MNSLWSTFDWTLARASGFTALLLLTLAVATGLALSIKWQSPIKWPRLINNELHNFLTLLSTVFVAIHVLTIWLDPFTHFSWYEVLIPFTAGYRRPWTAAGIIALYLGIAIGITTLLRPRIGYRMWRSLHVFTLLIYALVVLHGLTAGSDNTTWWGLGIYGLRLALIGSLVAVRLFKLAQSQKKVLRPLASATPGTPDRSSVPGQR